MNHFLSFLASFLLLFHHGPPPPPVPTPTPIIFHPYPSSNISVNWGAPSPDYTIFIVSNMLPGDSEFRSITITNNGSTARPLTVRGTKTFEFKNFSQVLNITIFKDNSAIYGPKLLAQFFTDSAAPSGISLGNLTGHTTAAYKFLVTFPSVAGNEYQLAKVVFDLKIGKILDIPDKCRKFHEDDGHDFTCDSGHRHVFASFDCEDKIDDHDTNHCTTTRSR